MRANALVFARGRGAFGAMAVNIQMQRSHIARHAHQRPTTTPQVVRHQHHHQRQRAYGPMARIYYNICICISYAYTYILIICTSHHW